MIQPCRPVLNLNLLTALNREHVIPFLYAGRLRSPGYFTQQPTQSAFPGRTHRRPEVNPPKPTLRFTIIGERRMGPSYGRRFRPRKPAITASMIEALLST